MLSLEPFCETENLRLLLNGETRLLDEIRFNGHEISIQSFCPELQKLSRKSSRALKRQYHWVMRFIDWLCVLASCAGVVQDIPKEYAAVLKSLDKKGDYKANVLKVNIPRNDLKVRVAGVDVPTSFGFGGWIAMTKGDGGTQVMMGDLVLVQDEVNPVLSALLDHGLEVTALHNHFFWEEPRIFYMHVHGMGSVDELTRKLKPALDLIGHALPSISEHSGSSDIVGGTLDTKALDAIVDATGDQNGQVYKYTIGRNDLKIKEMGATINARMGLNTWAAFYGTDDNCVVAGDVAMLEGEVTPVLKALRANGLDVVAIHHHMTRTKPMIISLHYWGEGKASTLARGFRAALVELGKKPGMRMASR